MEGDEFSKMKKRKLPQGIRVTSAALAAVFAVAAGSVNVSAAGTGSYAGQTGEEAYAGEDFSGADEALNGAADTSVVTADGSTSGAETDNSISDAETDSSISGAGTGSDASDTAADSSTTDTKSDSDTGNSDSGDEATEEKQKVNEDATPVAMYRMYNPRTGEHLYTADLNERNTLFSLLWNYEGIGWYAPKKSDVPVYRLFNPLTGEHHYTMDLNEYRTLGSLGWNQEGIGWYSDAEKSIPVYREFNPGASKNGHNFTASETEDRILVSQYHFNAEGIAWYAVPDPDPTVKSPVTIYKGTDFSAIYDFSYYWNHYTDVQQSVGRYDDAGTLKHFVETGLKEGRQAKESCDQTVYDDLKNKLYNPYPEATAVLDQIGHNLHVETVALLIRNN